MALANEGLRDPYFCNECGYFYFNIDASSHYAECPDCGPSAKWRKELRRREHQIQRLNKQLQEAIYEQ